MVKFMLDSFGIDEHHTPEHLAEATIPENTYLLMCFATPIMILTDDGMARGEPGDCMLQTPFYHEYHHMPPGEPGGFINDWLHFICKGGMARDLIDSYAIPTNRLIHANDVYLFRKLMVEIHNEQLVRRPLYQERLSLLIEEMMLCVARAAVEQHIKRSPFADDLILLRRDLLQNYTHHWTVEEMGRRLNLSASRFSALYRQQFDISPMDDLIGIRVNAARLLLFNTNNTLREIAIECGFQNEYYFSRVFKNRMNISPGKYRR